MKSLVIALILGLVSNSLAETFNWFEESKIVNGKPTRNSEVPYLVYLQQNGNFKCGGAMVSKSHVVTAAHCVDDTQARYLTVVGGATYLGNGGTRRQVQYIIKPKEWNAKTLRSDISVLKLVTPMPNAVAVLPLCSRPVQVGAVMKLSGWGTKSEFSNSPSYQVQTYESVVYDKQRCSNVYRNLGPTMFCISNNNGKDTCQGDSGGPAVHNGELCGVVSFGNGCARIGYPGVYTDVYNVKDFVTRAMAY